MKAPAAVLVIGVALFVAGQLFAYLTSLSGPADANIGAGIIALAGGLTAVVGGILLVAAALRRMRK